MKNKNLIFIFSFCLTLSGCGWKLDPEPLFPTSPTNIDKEISHRKNEKNKNNKSTDPKMSETK